VTHTAEVAVKRASTKVVVFPGAAETGSQSRTAPVRMIEANPIKSTRAGVNR
jgi:hypothetical protein